MRYEVDIEANAFEASRYTIGPRDAPKVIQPPVPRDGSRPESDVIKELRAARSQVWRTLAREREGTPAEPDFARFGRFRKPDR